MNSRFSQSSVILTVLIASDTRVRVDEFVMTAAVRSCSATKPSSRLIVSGPVEAASS